MPLILVKALMLCKMPLFEHIHYRAQQGFTVTLMSQRKSLKTNYRGLLIHVIISCKKVLPAYERHYIAWSLFLFNNGNLIIKWLFVINFYHLNCSLPLNIHLIYNNKLINKMNTQISTNMTDSPLYVTRLNFIFYTSVLILT